MKTRISRAPKMYSKTRKKEETKMSNSLRFGSHGMAQVSSAFNGKSQLKKTAVVLIDEWNRVMCALKKERAVVSTPGSHVSCLPKHFFHCDFCSTTIWIAGTQNIKRSVNNSVCFFLLFAFESKTWRIFSDSKQKQPTTFVCALGASTHVSHLPYTDWNDIETIDAFPKCARTYSESEFRLLWCKPMSMCSGCVAEENVCNVFRFFIYDSVFQVSSEFDTRACLCFSPKKRTSQQFSSGPRILMSLLYWDEPNSMCVHRSCFFFLNSRQCVEMHKCILARWMG